MAINEILAFASGVGANLSTQAEYAADAQRSSGNVPGVARSKLVNKAARQAAFVSAMIGQFIADTASIDVLDDADIPGLKTDFIAALMANLRNAFTGSNQLLATAGYQKLPGGLIVQWGAVDTTSSGVSVVWPVAFPNAARRVICSHSSRGGAVASSVADTTKTGGDFYLAGATGTVNYLAIGD